MDMAVARKTDKAGLDFERARLANWMDSRFGVAPLVCTRISGGQSNPTYFVDHGARRFVLRKKPAGRILPGAHAIEREYRVLCSLSQTDVPVPRAIELCDDPAILGTPFYLMERLEGRVFADASLAEVPREDRSCVYFSMAEALAKLHAVSPDSVGIGDFGKKGDYFKRQFSRWSKQYAESTGDRIAALDNIISWLGENMPENDSREVIVHGDFRLGNLLFHPVRPEVVGILDWELSTLGHPLADLGFCCMTWVTSPDEYGGIQGLNLARLGIPDMEEFLKHYYKQAPDAPELRPFHIAFALFRFAVIFVGIADRSRMGNAADPNAAALAPLAQRFAQKALELTS